MTNLFKHDYDLFMLIHGLSGHSFLDHTMVAFSNERIWILVAVLALGYLVYKKNKFGLKVFLLLGLSIGITDLFTVRLLKPWLGRLRPCREFQDFIVVVQGWCGGDYGFPSTHAANAAAVAAILCFLIPRKWFAIVAVLAGMVGFSRIYIGVHYPGDVLAGFVVGGAIGTLFWYGWSKAGLLDRPKNPLL